jgi:hypothetical protein
VDAAAELGEDEHGDAVAVALRGEARVEGGQRGAEVVEQGGLRALLARVGVVAVLGDVEDAQAEARADEQRGQLEAAPELAAREVAARAGAQGVQALGAVEGVELGVREPGGLALPAGGAAGALQAGALRLRRPARGRVDEDVVQ